MLKDLITPAKPEATRVSKPDIVPLLLKDVIEEIQRRPEANLSARDPGKMLKDPERVLQLMSINPPREEMSLAEVPLDPFGMGPLKGIGKILRGFDAPAAGILGPGQLREGVTREGPAHSFLFKYLAAKEKPELDTALEYLRKWATRKLEHQRAMDEALLKGLASPEGKDFFDPAEIKPTLQALGDRFSLLKFDEKNLQMDPDVFLATIGTRSDPFELLAASFPERVKAAEKLFGKEKGRELLIKHLEDQASKFHPFFGTQERRWLLKASPKYAEQEAKSARHIVEVATRGVLQEPYIGKFPSERINYHVAEILSSYDDPVEMFRKLQGFTPSPEVARFWMASYFNRYKDQLTSTQAKWLEDYFARGRDLEVAGRQLRTLAIPPDKLNVTDLGNVMGDILSHRPKLPKETLKVLPKEAELGRAYRIGQEGAFQYIVRTKQGWEYYQPHFGETMDFVPKDPKFKGAGHFAKVGGSGESPALDLMFKNPVPGKAYSLGGHLFTKDSFGSWIRWVPEK